MLRVCPSRPAPRYIAALLLALVPATASAQRHARLIARVDSLADSTLKAGPIPGMSIAVARRREVMHARGYGFADLERRVPATESTVYRIASITKQFTAAAIMQLVEKKKLRVEDEITRYLPDYPTQGHKVKVEHLLAHTSGIRNFTSLGARWQDNARPRLSHEALVALFKNEPFEFPPGERFSYSNSGYYLLGLIIERVSGQSYGDYLRDQVFVPHGLTASSYCPAEAREGEARGYRLSDGVLRPVEATGMSLLYAAGSLCSTVLDLITWQRALEDRKPVNALSWSRMTTPIELKDGSRASYGYGLMLGQLARHRSVEHGGGLEGFSTILIYYPESEVTVAVLANAEHALVRPVAERIARMVLNVPEPKVKDRPIKPDELPRYAGDYQAPNDRLGVSIEADRLLLRFGEGDPIRLRYQGHHAFVAESDPTLEVRFVMRGDRARGLVLTLGGLTLDARRIE